MIGDFDTWWDHASNKERQEFLDGCHARPAGGGSSTAAPPPKPPPKVDRLADIADYQPNA